MRSHPENARKYAFVCASFMNPGPGLWCLGQSGVDGAEEALPSIAITVGTEIVLLRWLDSDLRFGNTLAAGGGYWAVLFIELGCVATALLDRECQAWQQGASEPQ